MQDKIICFIQVFERSFDGKLTTNLFFLDKLTYIHNHPCNGVGGLVANPVDYKYSSAKYYIAGMQSEYPIDSE